MCNFYCYNSKNIFSYKSLCAFLFPPQAKFVGVEFLDQMVWHSLRFLSLPATLYISPNLFIICGKTIISQFLFACWFFKNYL